VADARSIDAGAKQVKKGNFSLTKRGKEGGKTKRKKKVRDQ